MDYGTSNVVDFSALEKMYLESVDDLIKVESDMET
jgi:hypothetical protein